MSVPFVTGNVTATDWFILLYYRNLLCVNSGLLYLTCMFIGFGFLGNKLFVSTADRLRASLTIGYVNVTYCINLKDWISGILWQCFHLVNVVTKVA